MGSTKSTAAYAQELLTEWELAEHLGDDSPDAFRAKVKKTAYAKEAASFKDRDSASKLCYFRQHEPIMGGKVAPALQPRLPQRISRGRDICMRHACGTNDLQMDRGRAERLSPDQRLCKTCPEGNAVPEDAVHFALTCPARQALVAKLRSSLRELPEDTLHGGVRVSEMDPATLHTYLQNPRRTGPQAWAWYRHLVESWDHRERMVPGPSYGPRRPGRKPPASPRYVNGRSHLSRARSLPSWMSDHHVNLFG